MANSDSTIPSTSEVLHITLDPEHNGLEDFDQGLFLSKSRSNVAMEVSWEIELLSQNLAQEIHGLEEGLQLLHLRGMALRIKQINSALMSALCESGMKISELEQALHGISMSEEANHV